MPRVSRFFGITIATYYNDHQPPHFHALYAEHEATLTMAPLETLSDRLPRWALSLVLEWAVLHRSALQENWETARQALPLLPIDPFD